MRNLNVHRVNPYQENSFLRVSCWLMTEVQHSYSKYCLGCRVRCIQFCKPEGNPQMAQRVRQWLHHHRRHRRRHHLLPYSC